MSPRTKRVLGAGLLLGAFPLAYFLGPTIHDHPVSVCVYRSVLGKACPFCGLTRAFAAATHGDFAAASAHNAMWPLAALVFLGGGLYFLVTAFARGQTALASLKGRRAETVILLLALATLVAAMLLS